MRTVIKKGRVYRNGKKTNEKFYIHEERKGKKKVMKV